MWSLSGQHGLFVQEKMVRCPLEPEHIIKESRLQFHLVRCMKNFKGVQITRCPFNATHLLLPPNSLENHLDKCPDKMTALSFKYRTCTGLKDRVAPVGKREVQGAEDWTDCNQPSYDPARVMRKKTHLIPPALIGASKREKQKHKEKLMSRLKEKQDSYYPGLVLSDSSDVESHN